MGNPALEEFQTRLAEQLADALLGKAAALMMAERAVADVVPLAEPVIFTKGDILRAVRAVTAGWRADYKRTRIRDAKGITQDGIDLAGPVHEPVTHIVRLHASTFIDRNETPAEQAARREYLEALLWNPEKGPPPKRVSLLELFEQDIWWVPKGAEPIRLVDMDDSHRRNLAAFLRRNAAHYKNAEWAQTVGFMTGPQGPSGDMATDAANSELHQLEEVDPLVWLSEKPLMRALIPTVYLWQPEDRPLGMLTSHAVHEDGTALVSFTSKRRRVALAAIQPPAAEQVYRDLLGGIGPAFYHLVTLEPGAELPEGTRIAFEEVADE